MTNDCGPPALGSFLEGDRTLVVSDSSWQVSLSGSTENAILAGSRILYPKVDRYRILEPRSGFSGVWPLWLLFSALSAAVVFGVRGWLLEPNSTRFTRRQKWSLIRRASFFVIVMAWAVLFTHNSARLRTLAGFDASGHLDYVNYVKKTWTVPLATQGWEAYQPPLYYLMAALAVAKSASDIRNGYWDVGPQSIESVFGPHSARRDLGSLDLLYPRKHPARGLVGLLFAAFLPMHLYLFQYPTNETLAATLAAVTVYLVLRILRVSGAPERFCIIGDYSRSSAFDQGIHRRPRSCDRCRNSRQSFGVPGFREPHWPFHFRSY